MSPEDSYLLGIEAYQSKDFPLAILHLKQAAPEQWDAQLYLGMSYYMTGAHVEARQHFAKLREECPVTEIRDKAVAAFAAVNSKMMQAERSKREEDQMTVEW